MTCTEVADEMSAFLDREGVARATARHLEACSRCDEQLADLRQVSELVQVPEFSRDPGFVVRFRQLREERLLKAEGRFWKLWTLRLAPVAAAIWLVIALQLTGSEPRDDFDVALAALADGSEMGVAVEEDLTLAGGLSSFARTGSVTERVDR